MKQERIFNIGIINKVICILLDVHIYSSKNYMLSTWNNQCANSLEIRWYRGDKKTMKPTVVEFLMI